MQRICWVCVGGGGVVVFSEIYAIENNNAIKRYKINLTLRNVEVKLNHNFSLFISEDIIQTFPAYLNLLKPVREKKYYVAEQHHCRFVRELQCICYNFVGSFQPSRMSFSHIRHFETISRNSHVYPSILKHKKYVSTW